MRRSFFRHHGGPMGPRGRAAASIIAAIALVPPAAFAQSTDIPARHLPDFSSYSCESTSQAGTASTRHIGQVIKGHYTEWYESYALKGVEQRLACISVIQPTSRQLNADQAKTFLTDSYAVGAPNTPATAREASAAASAEPDNVQAEPLKHLREPTASSATGTQSTTVDGDLPPLPASKTFSSDAPTQQGSLQSPSTSVAPAAAYETPATTGVDDRTPVTATQAYPWNTVAYFTATYTQGGSFRCTATIVSPYVVLTAGHCVHNNTRGGYFASGRVYPGQRQANAGDGIAVDPYASKGDIASVQTTAQWTQISGNDSYPVTDYKYDYSAVMFSTPFTHTSTFMPVLYSSTVPSVTSAGYPAVVKGANAYGLYTETGSETSRSAGYRSSNVREFAVDASGGNSGGPFIYTDPATGQNYLVGSLSYGDDTNDRAGGPWYDSWNQALISSWVAWTPTKESTTASTAGLRVASVFSSVQSEMLSYLRFYNDSATAGTVDVTLADSSTGTALAAWHSPSLPAHSSRQFSISEVESGANTNFTKPQVYSLSVRPTFAGNFQNVLWRNVNATLTNLSACDTRNQDAMTLVDIHSSLLDNGYPSAVVIYNTASTTVSPTFGIFNAETGQRLGTYSPGQLPANSQTSVAVNAIEAAAGITPNGVYHYNIKADSSFQGFVQHLLNNQSAHLITDMTASCPMTP